MMKFIYDNFETCSNQLALAFFFNARGQGLEHSIEGMYRSLLHQIFTAEPQLSADAILEKKYGYSQQLPRWTVETLQDVFRRSITEITAKSVFLIIDALDESSHDEVSEIVAHLEEVSHTAMKSDNHVRVCLSSRHYPYITVTDGIEVILEDQEEHSQDIENYLHAELRIGQSEISKSIRSQILHKASDNFLWIVLVVPMLNRAYERGRIFELQSLLKTLPDKLEHLFDQIVICTDQDARKELTACLRWVLFAFRPLSLQELYSVLLFELDLETQAEGLRHNVTEDDMARFVLDVSKGLVEQTKSEFNHMQFVHETVRDYLLKGQFSHLEFFVPNATVRLRSHEVLKCVCYNYLSHSFDHKPTTSYQADFSIPIPTRPFQHYAVRYILHHCNEAESIELPQRQFIIDLPYDRWMQECYLRGLIFRHITLLAWLAAEGLANITGFELERRDEIESSPGFRHLNPIYGGALAQSRGVLTSLLTRMPGGKYHEQTKRLASLMQQHYLTDLTDSTVLLMNIFKDSLPPNEPPVAFAVQQQSLSLLRCLLVTGRLDPDGRGNESPWGRTPLSHAAQLGNEEMVECLLNAGAQPFLADNHSTNALSYAVSNFHNRIVEMLAKITVGSKAMQQTYLMQALSASSGSRNQHAAQVILEAAVDHGFVDDEARTAIVDSIKRLEWNALDQELYLYFHNDDLLRTFAFERGLNAARRSQQNATALI